MDSIDYGKKLSSLQNQYRSSINDISKSKERTISQLEEQKNQQLSEQSNTHKKSLRDLQERFKNRELETSDFIDIELDKKKQILRDELARVRSNYSENTMDQKEEYARKISNLNDQYRENLDQLEQSSKRFSANEKNQYEKRFDQNKNYFDKAIKDTATTSRLSVDEANQKNSLENKKMSKEFQKKISDLSQQNSNDEIQNKERYADKFDRFQEQTSQKVDNIEKSYEGKSDQLTKNYKESLNRNSEGFADKYNSQSKNFDKMLLDLERENDQKVSDITKSYETKIAMKKGSGAQRDQVDKLKEHYDRAIAAQRDRFDQRLGIIQENNIEANKDIEQKVADIYRRSKYESDNLKADFRAKQFSALEDVSTVNQEKLLSEKLKTNRALEQFGRETERIKENTIEIERLEKEKTKRSKELFTKKLKNELDVVNTQRERSQIAMRADATRDKELLLQDFEKRFTESFKAERQKSLSKIERNQSGQERVIDGLKGQLEVQDVKTKSRIQKIQSQKANELNRQKDFYEAQLDDQKAEQSSEGKTIASKNNDLVNQIQREYNQRMIKQSSQFEEQLGHITNKYEVELQQQRTDFVKKLESEKQMKNETSRRLHENFESQKQSIISRYESIIAEMKTSHEQQEANMRNFLNLQAAKN